MQTIYLVAQMSSKSETYDWRFRFNTYIVKFMKSRTIEENIKIINPFKNKRSVDYFFGEETNFTKDELLLIPPQDANYVKQSTIAIANMNHYTPETPMIGSYFELSLYCFMYPEKPVIGIFSGDHDNDYQCSNPFVRQAIHCWVENEEQAAKLIINSYF